MPECSSSKTILTWPSLEARCNPLRPFWEEKETDTYKSFSLFQTLISTRHVSLTGSLRPPLTTFGFVLSLTVVILTSTITRRPFGTETKATSLLFVQWSRWPKEPQVYLFELFHWANVQLRRSHHISFGCHLRRKRSPPTSLPKCGSGSSGYL